MGKPAKIVFVTIVDSNTGNQTERQAVKAPVPNEVTIWDIRLDEKTDNISIRVDWSIEE